MYSWAVHIKSFGSQNEVQANPLNPSPPTMGLFMFIQEGDNLSTKDKWAVPKVSFVQSFYCMHFTQYADHT